MPAVADDYQRHRDDQTSDDHGKDGLPHCQCPYQAAPMEKVPMDTHPPMKLAA